MTLHRGLLVAAQQVEIPEYVGAGKHGDVLEKGKCPLWYAAIHSLLSPFAGFAVFLGELWASDVGLFHDLSPGRSLS